MRPSDQIHARIRWDPRLDETRFTLLVDVHADALKRTPFVDFVPGGDVPWHRVVAFLFDGAPCWDRRTRLDSLDDLAATGVAAPWRLVAPWAPRVPVVFDVDWAPVAAPPEPVAWTTLEVLTWNVLWDRYDAEHIASAERWPRLLDLVLGRDADLIALQEIQPALHRAILDDPRVQAGYWVSHPAGHADVGPYDLLLLGRRDLPPVQVGLLPYDAHKAALAAVVLTHEGPLTVVTTHLSSDHRADATRRRADELATLRSALDGRTGSAIVLGDFNLDDDDPASDGLLGATDAWTALRVPRPTFDPEVNPLARFATRTGKPRRLDRVLVRGHLSARHVELLGTEPVRGHWPSDHFGVAATLARGPVTAVCQAEPTVRSALAWVPDEAVQARLAAVREAHDRAWPRWPAHVNVLWGFVAEHALGEALAALTAAAAAVPPFSTRLDVPGAFGDSHHLRPGDTGPWDEARRAFASRFPRCASAERTTPHLTYATGEAPPPPDPVTDHIDRLAVLTRRGDDPFAVRAIVHLGTGLVEDVPEPIVPLEDPLPHDDVVALLAARLGGRLDVVGSRAMGIALDGADLDLVWLTDTPDVEAMVSRLDAPPVRDLRAVRKNGLPGLRFRVGDLWVDLAAAHPDNDDAAVIRSAIADAMAMSRALDGRRDLARLVKGWARAQGLDDPALGGVESLAWAVLVGRCPDPTPMGFFSHLGSQRWDRHVHVPTPTPPVRNVTTRADGRRLEAALVEAWERLDAGADPRELLRPPPWHRRHRWAVRVWWHDDASRGRFRGAAHALLQVIDHPVQPRALEDGVALGLPRGADVDDIAARLSPIHGVRMALCDTTEVP